MKSLSACKHNSFYDNSLLYQIKNKQKMRKILTVNMRDKGLIQVYITAKRKSKMKKEPQKTIYLHQ